MRYELSITLSDDAPSEMEELTKMLHAIQSTLFKKIDDIFVSRYIRVTDWQQVITSLSTFLINSGLTTLAGMIYWHFSVFF